MFYPPGSKQEELLPFYARVFDTVELDNTFYKPPKPTIARSWARHTPDGFRFAAKAPRAVTHDAALRGTSADMAELARSLEPLGEKLGPVLVQMPAEFVRTAENVAALRRFLLEAPQALDLAVEFRDASWHVAATLELLREHEAAVAWTQWRDLPAWCEITAPFLYVRWLGTRADISRYDKIQIDRGGELATWVERLRQASGVVDEIYGYVNNHYAGHSPETVNDLKRRLGEPIVDPKSFWPQRELFGGIGA
ncbi:MAG TPA: DUF72 domain-containing protein [Candidatus Eisenbacteria bacterium]|nr:DUF72 domain-containing protein [Candidatus Eisenbacteria bacterium]